MQPTYLPWAGYFELIKSVDVFVIYDDVQFEKSSWQSRNRILENGQASYISCPVQHGSLATLIKDVPLAQRQLWPKKHAKRLKQIYQAAPFFSQLEPLFDYYQHAPHVNLADNNTAIIRLFCDMLGLDTEIVRSSELDIQGSRISRLINICDYFGAEFYHSPIGAKAYLGQGHEFALADIELRYQQYLAPQYQQFNSREFVSHLSIVDVLANLDAEQAKQYIIGETACPSMVSRC